MPSRRAAVRSGKAWSSRWRREEKRRSASISAYALVAKRFCEHARRARLIGSNRLEVPRKVVGHGDCAIALREVSVVVRHVVSEMRQHFGGVYVVLKLHQRVEHGAEHRAVQLRAFAHLGATELRGGL